MPATWAGIARGLHWTEDLVSTDPVTLRLTVRHGGDRIRFLLDATGAVVDVCD